MIKDNILQARARIASVCAKLGLNPDSITIVCVAKNRTIEKVKEAIACGLFNIGENRVQEALLKYDQLSGVKWHLVGHLQTNKVKDAVKIFDLIHSVDSLRLAGEINKQAARIGKIQDILIEVKTSPEAAKYGVLPEETAGLVEAIKGLKNVSLKGLMTIAPLLDNPEETRPYFKQLRQLKDKICIDFGFRVSDFGLLSMGMTDDFEVAIEEGANIIRIGRGIFDRI
ncbi:MAG: YggS family pyridoxal phosphate-dependent enzyme [Candidatus Omnitrophica bacterium]|nr:YggS family pyridoxal phosphate-dependent enzyme [Candidatus Omnitrophota bacterium]